MNKRVKIILAIACVFGAMLSTSIAFYLSIINNRDALGEWLAPVHINMELNKEYAYNLSILSEPMGNKYYYFSPTTKTDTDMRNIVMHTELRSTGFHHRIFLRMPESTAEEAINSMDNISVFIGNKLYYFSRDDIQKFSGKTKDGYILFQIPGLHYTKSLVIKDWINYYGDFNIALKIFCGFLFFPYRFIPTYLFLAGLLLLYRKQLKALYRRIRQRPEFWAVVLVAVITVFGFALRINGYVRHSGWTDEMYSAVRTGNPNLPLIATFSDPGNPPFYPMLLRCWFKLFGWSEEAGTMLSVVLGTLAIPALYLLVKRNFSKGTAFLASFFMAISGSAVGYSQEMRTYVVLLFLLPIITLLFFNFLRCQSLKNLLFYILPSLCIVNAHYYGILFIIANFIFYCFYERFNKTFKWKKMVIFLTGNILIALFFMPFFLYQMIVKRYDFNREFTIRIDHVLIFIVISILTTITVIYRKKIILSRVCTNKQAGFFLYSLFMPLAVFVLAFLISLKKPMISYKYIMPVGFPFFLSVAAILVSLCALHKKLKYLPLFLVWTISASLYLGKPRIEGGGFEYYRESRAYIAADAAAHPGQKSAMLDNAPQNAHYYGFKDLPCYSPENPPEALYVFNDIADMHEELMYDELARYGLDDTNMLKIYPSDKIVIFKKMLF